MSFGYFKEIRGLLDKSAEINVMRTRDEVKISLPFDKH